MKRNLRAEKFAKIHKILQSDFAWAKSTIRGVEYHGPFLNCGDHWYWLAYGRYTGVLTLEHGEEFSQPIDLLCEYNASDEFTREQCSRINARCRDLLESRGENVLSS